MFATLKVSRSTVTGVTTRLRLHRSTASFLALLVGAACADDRIAPATPADLTPTASELRGFSADVEMSVTKAGVRSTSRSRIERREKAPGQWVTRVTRPIHTRAGETGNEKTLVTTVEVSDDGSVSAFGADGTKIPVESFTPVPQMGKTNSSLRPLPAFPQNPGQGRRSSDGDAWFDNVVVTQKSVARMTARLERKMSRVADAKGTLRYLHSGKVQAEIVVDPITGAVLEENTSGPTGRLVHAKHSYTRLGTGTLVRNFSRIEYGPSGDPKGVVVESTLRNITLTPRTEQ